MMFFIALPAPRVSLSDGTGFGCFLAHAGSASMASAGRLGTFPSKMTVPVIDAATVPVTDEVAIAAVDQHHTATAAAATSHNVFFVTRLLNPLVIAELLFVIVEWFQFAGLVSRLG